MKNRICLFTAHSPNTGGGAVILKSLIENLYQIKVDWRYLAPTAAKGYENGYFGMGFMGTGILNDVKNTWTMLSNKPNAVIDEIVERLIKVDCKAYWVVSHNEGIRVALELSKRQPRPVHLTVHDDWAGALCARSLRYMLMKNAANKITVTTLNSVTSVDVISDGMKKYYEKLSDRKFEVCHRYLKPDMLLSNVNSSLQDNNVINIGHIGSIYRKKDFILFLENLKQFFTKQNKKPVVHLWGIAMRYSDIPEQLKENVKFYPTLPENEVIIELAKCEFVYSMYPLSANLNVFSKTSLPTKLTSYVIAGRPIFGHCPKDSTLNDFLDNTGTGVYWISGKKEDCFSALDKILKLAIKPESWENARKQYFGENNLALINNLFAI